VLETEWAHAGSVAPASNLEKSESQTGVFINIAKYSDTHAIFELFSDNKTNPNRLTVRVIYGDFKGKYSTDIRKFIDNHLLRHMYKQTPLSWPKATMRYAYIHKEIEYLYGDYDPDIVSKKMIALPATMISKSSRILTLKAIKDLAIDRRKIIAADDTINFPIVEYVGIWTNIDEGSNLIIGDDIYKTLDPLILAINPFKTREAMKQANNVTV
jgi:hypothetical protein